jgi:ADP-dependent NAD(P)H-hydrate dehydratase / NAD(P)H-hydrate epimerase
MKSVLSREQSRQFDGVAAERLGIPTLLLMENAGRGAADAILSEFAPRSVVVVAGTGNNGGDGFVVARHLRLARVSVLVFVVGDVGRMTGDAAVMAGAWVGMGGAREVIARPEELSRLVDALGRADLVVDALFGTGLSRPIEGLVASAITAINASSRPVVALDVPSGLDTDTARIWGCAVRATTTVAFSHSKPVHFTATGADYGGTLEVRSIGVVDEAPLHVGEVAVRPESADLRGWLGPRPLTLHKGRAGRVMVLGGSVGTSGAALLAARGALRGGAGLVTHVGTRESILGIESRSVEAMTAVLDERRIVESLDEQLARADAIVFGPGLGFSRTARLIAHTVLSGCHAPLVVDADGITLLAEDPKVLASSGPPRVLLPHPGEMARLLDTTIEEVLLSPLGAVAAAVQRTFATVVLKGPYTVVGAPGRTPAIVGRPCPALSVGGSGDVLAGLVGALLVEHGPFEAAMLGVALHNEAGQLWQQRTGAARGLLAHEIADGLPEAFARLAEPDR